MTPAVDASLGKRYKKSRKFMAILGTGKEHHVSFEKPNPVG
jgi:hypothetical protein